MTPWIMLAVMFATSARELSCTAELRIEPRRVVAEAGTLMHLELIVRNTGTRPITLVEPGDGSHDGARTPLLQWWKTDLTGEAEGTRQRVGLVGTFCPHVNSLRRGEVFDLEPGAEKRLRREWTWPPGIVRPGRYRVTAVYRNRPVAWHGSSAAGHDPDELGRLLRSTPCLLQAEMEVRGTERPAAAAQAP
jgi:hypothetical protein